MIYNYFLWVLVKYFILHQEHKLIVYYDDFYKQEWFSNFSKYNLKFVKFKHSSNKATQIIQLKNFQFDTYKIYLVNTPLLHDIHGKKNYHIKGLTYLNIPLSVVTVQNMNDNNVKKVILHEFAHGEGLDHCTHYLCIMNDAKGKFDNLKNCNFFKKSCLEQIQSRSRINL